MVLTARPGADRGVVAVVTALVVTFVVLPLLALVVDLGIARVAAGRARTAADSAALAAALQRPTSATVESAREAAENLVADNAGVPTTAWGACVDPHPLPVVPASAPDNCVSFDPTACQVRVMVPPRVVPGVFSGLLGTTAPVASAVSTATWGTPEATGCTGDVRLLPASP